MLIILIMTFIQFILIMLIIAVSLLNLHEDERSQPSAWIPVGRLPVYNEERDERPGQGYESASARKHRLYHRCWAEFLDGWAERTKESEVLPWADGASRQTLFFLGGELGDQLEGDGYTGEPCVLVILHMPSMWGDTGCGSRDRQSAAQNYETDESSNWKICSGSKREGGY